MHLLLEMIEKKNLSLLLVTHDLGLVAQSCKTMTVLERGEIREKGLVESILQNPQHEYTQSLLKGAKFG
jgi:ABC-type dipeptide/oligopeptide/nickel transport system ATPase component